MHSVNMMPKEGSGYRAYILNNDDGMPVWTSNDAQFEGDEGIGISMEEETFVFEADLTATHLYFIAVHEKNGLSARTAEECASQLIIVDEETGVALPTLELDKARYVHCHSHKQAHATSVPTFYVRRTVKRLTFFFALASSRSSRPLMESASSSARHLTRHPMPQSSLRRATETQQCASST